MDIVEQIIHFLIGGQYRVYYDVDSLYEVADALLRSGFYGRVPVAFRWYIDFDKVIHDLEDAGWHFQPEVRVAVQPLL